VLEQSQSFYESHAGSAARKFLRNQTER
jgi:hypothetical protein